MEATGTVRLPAESTPREQLRLVLSNVMRDLSVEVLEPVESTGQAALELKEVQRNTDAIWIVRPTQPIPAGATVLLRFNYAGGEQPGFVFNLNTEVSVASAFNTRWYPMLDADTPTRGKGTLRLTVPSEYVAVADEGQQLSTPEEIARGVYQFSITHPTLFSFAVGKFTIHRRQGRVPLAAYVLRSRPNLERYIDGVSGILNVIAEEFGPFPFREAMIVEVPREVSSKSNFDGFAFAGGIVVQSGSFDKPEFNIDLPYLAHELGHQWFPHSVGITVDAKGGRYVAEGLAQYASLRAVEKLIGPQAAKQYRSSGIPTWGNGTYSAIGYLQMTAAGLDNNLGELPGARDGQRLQYLKGHLVWDMLAREIGLEKFRRILHHITQQHAFSQLPWQELLRVIETDAGRDLDWFYEQWFYRTGAPEWRLTWQQEGDLLRGRVTQSPPYYRSDILVHVEASDGQRLVRTLQIRGPQTEFAWHVPFRTNSVDLDPDYLTLHWTTEFHAIATALIPFTQEQRKQALGQAANVEKGLRAALEEVPNPDLYGIRFRLEYNLANTLSDPVEAKKHLEAALSCPTRARDDLPWVYLRLVRIAQQMKDDEALRAAVQNTISADAALGGRTGAGALARAAQSKN